MPVEWDSAGQFTKELAVPAGKFVEACEKLPKGARIAWSFEATSPMDFNIHYHEGKDVLYPARKAKTAGDSGELLTHLDQDYCWMWTNKGTAPASLRIKLNKR